MVDQRAEMQRDTRPPWEKAQARFDRVTKGGRTLVYCMNVIQQPERARACGSGAKSSADRRPVDPPPVVELRIFEGAGDEKSDVTFGYKANFFLFATLEMARPMAHGRVQPPQQQIPVLTGMPVSGMAYLDRPLEAGYFIFPDLSVRHEGKYKLSFNLYEETKEDMDKDSPSDAPTESKSLMADGSAPDKSFDWRLEVKSESFMVFSAKKFPGLAESTLLSRTVAEQGCRVRIRRDVRMRRRDDKPNFDAEEEYSRGRPESIQGEYQRSRSLSSEVGESPLAQQRRASGEWAQAPAGGHLNWIGGGQQQAGQFATPQPPQPSFQTPQYAPPQYRQSQPQPLLPNTYPYDRPSYQQHPQQYPQSAYPSSSPREHEFEPEYRRASMPASYNSQPAPYPSAGSDFSRNTSYPAHARPETPAGPVQLPPLKMADPKYENQSSPLSSITRVTSGVVSPIFEPGLDRSYGHYHPTPLPSIDEAARNGKRSYAATFSNPTAIFKHEPLFNGMRPSTAHMQEEDSQEDLKISEMIYKRANGDPQRRIAPDVYNE